ncbi:MFS transporter, partial [Candidatus Peregrinibacteria bacterium]|nr:MFS transporter [Candidatus Peregrinibacteria bacterium]
MHFPFFKTKAKKTIWTFALVSYLNDFGADMVHSLWPVFLTQTLGLNMALLGLIDGLGDAMISISQAVSGYFSDRIHRRKIFIWAGYLLSAVSRFGFAVAGGLPMALSSKLVERAGKMRDTPRDAIAAEVSEHADRGGNFGILRTMDSFGAVCGVLVSIWLIRFMPIRTLFAVAAIPSIVGAILVLTVIHEENNGFKLYEGLHWKNLSGSFRWFLVLSALFSIASFSYSFLLIFAKKFGFTLTEIPVLYLIYMAGAMVASYPLGHLADILSRRAVIFMGFAFWAATLSLLMLSPSPTAIYISFLLFGFSKGAIETVQRTYVSELAPTGYVASALGTFKLVVG